MMKTTLGHLILEHDLKYPAGALLCFDGYKGIDDYKSLCLYQHLIDKAASADGTRFTIGLCKKMKYVHSPYVLLFVRIMFSYC